MPRVIVTTDPSPLPNRATVLFDERVCSVHLSTSHGSGQLVERLAWAISDAESAEHAPEAARARPRRRSVAARGKPSGRSDARGLPPVTVPAQS